MAKKFGIIRNNPINKLRRRYNKLLKKSEEFKNIGDLISFEKINQEAELLLKKLSHYQSLIN
jgi:hypothetical protein